MLLLDNCQVSCIFYLQETWGFSVPCALQTSCPLLSQAHSPDSFLLAWLCISAAADLKAKPQAQNPTVIKHVEQESFLPWGCIWWTVLQADQACSGTDNIISGLWFSRSWSVGVWRGVSPSAQWKVSSVCLSLLLWEWQLMPTCL